MLKAIIHIPSHEVDRLTPYLFDLGCEGLEVIDHNTLEENPLDQYGEIYRLNPKDFPKEGAQIIAYFDDQENLLQTLREGISNEGCSLLSPLKVESLEEVDYQAVYEEEALEVVINGQLSVVPPWFKIVDQKKNYLIIEPGTGFGTGTHETTRLCMELLQSTVRSNDTVIDLGCGSGILAILASKLTKGNIYGVELDPLAIKNAKQNALHNKARITFDSTMEDIKEKADVIVANIVYRIIVQLLDNIALHLTPHGHCILSGILIEEAEGMEKVLKQKNWLIVEKRDGQAFVAYVVRIKD